MGGWTGSPKRSCAIGGGGTGVGGECAVPIRAPLHREESVRLNGEMIEWHKSLRWRLPGRPVVALRYSPEYASWLLRNGLGMRSCPRTIQLRCPRIWGRTGTDARGERADAVDSGRRCEVTGTKCPNQSAFPTLSVRPSLDQIAAGLIAPGPVGSLRLSRFSQAGSQARFVWARPPWADDGSMKRPFRSLSSHLKHNLPFLNE